MTKIHSPTLPSDFRRNVFWRVAWLLNFTTRLTLQLVLNPFQFLLTLQYTRTVWWVLTNTICLTHAHGQTTVTEWYICLARKNGETVGNKTSVYQQIIVIILMFKIICDTAFLAYPTSSWVYNIKVFQNIFSYHNFFFLTQI